MLTTTENHDLIAELRTLAALTLDVTTVPELAIGDAYSDLFGPKGTIKLLHARITSEDPFREDSILPVWNNLQDLKRETDKAADSEHTLSVIFERLERMADLLSAPA